MSVRQISIFLENKKGRLAEVTRLLAARGVNIRALSLADTADFGVLRIIVSDPDQCLSALKSNGIIAQVTEVLAVEMEDKPGGLSGVLAALDGAGLNVEYMYAYVEKTKANAIVICKVDEKERAARVLQENGIGTLSAAQLKEL
ncbi:MAG TPA: ACT domain-containing protein [Spirochaetia bacterium]|nr:ACT domain-containing protein [Spirochaetia bacterium]